MCHFHLVRTENNKELYYLLWNETNAHYRTFAEQHKEIELVIKDYQKWFHDIYNTSNPTTESPP